MHCSNKTQMMRWNVGAKLGRGVCDWCKIYSRCKLAPNLPPANPDKASCSNVLKGSSNDTFFAPNFNDKCGRLRALVKGFMDGKGVDLSWGSEIAENVNEQLDDEMLSIGQKLFATFEDFYCCRLWDCFANSSKYVNGLIFSGGYRFCNNC